MAYKPIGTLKTIHSAPEFVKSNDFNLFQTWLKAAYGTINDSLVEVWNGIGWSATGSGSNVPTLWTDLVNIPPPPGGRGVVYLDGYSIVGDGGEGDVRWIATLTRAPDGGTVSYGKQAVGLPGRFKRITSTYGIFNVKHFGAKGDTTQDDYPALNTALQAWAAAQNQGSGVAGGYGSVKLKIPAGDYYCTQPLIVSGVVGGVIEGDGMYASMINGYPQPGGVFAQLELRDCLFVTVKDLAVTTGQTTTTVQTSFSAGVTSFVVASATGLAVGQRISVGYAASGPVEEVHIASISGTTIGIAGQGFLYAHSATEYVVCGAACAVGCSTHYQSSGKQSHGNKFIRVQMNVAQLVDCLYAFGTVPLGGGPVLLRTSTLVGATGCTVWDATQLYVGQNIQLWDGAGLSEPVKTLTAVNPATGVISWSPATATYAHTAGGYSAPCSIVSASDVNNDEHVLTDCLLQDGMVAGAGIVGLNSLNVIFQNCEVSGSYAIVSARQGGSFKWLGGDASGSYVDWELGGLQSRFSAVSHCASEANGRSLLAHAQDQTQFLQMWFNHYDKKGQPSAPTPLVNVTATYTKLVFDECNMFAGGAGYGITMSDASTQGDLVLLGKCQLNVSALTLSGVLLTDHDTQWGQVYQSPPVETLSNGAAVRAIAAVYGPHQSGVIGPVERRPNYPLALTSLANNDGIVPVGDADLIASGPTGPYVVKGFQYGSIGQRQRIKFNINQQLTISNNSSSYMPILTGTGANVVFSAPGGFLIIDFWCDGTYWNVVNIDAGTLPVSQGGTGDASLTAHAVLIGEGTSPVAFAGPGGGGVPLLGQGGSADPIFTALSLAGAGVTGTLPLANEGAPTGAGAATVTGGGWNAAALKLSPTAYASSTTTTVPAGATGMEVEIVPAGGGGGGGAGGILLTAPNTGSTGGAGGGSGPKFIGSLGGLTAGTTVTITIGAGGAAGAGGAVASLGSAGGTGGVTSVSMPGNIGFWVAGASGGAGGVPGPVTGVSLGGAPTSAGGQNINSAPGLGVGGAGGYTVAAGTVAAGYGADGLGFSTGAFLLGGTPGATGGTSGTEYGGGGGGGGAAGFGPGTQNGVGGAGGTSTGAAGGAGSAGTAPDPNSGAGGAGGGAGANGASSAGAGAAGSVGGNGWMSIRWLP